MVDRVVYELGHDVGDEALGLAGETPDRGVLFDHLLQHAVLGETSERKALLPAFGLRESVPCGPGNSLSHDAAGLH